MTSGDPACDIEGKGHFASRRAVLGWAASAAWLSFSRPASAQDPPKAPGEVDLLASMVQKLGEPQHATRISPEEAAHYADRVPQALIRFWREHGRGAYFDGLYWLCDPEPFDPVLDFIFKQDDEFNPSDMTVVAYTAFGDLKVWHRHRRQMNVSLLLSSVFNPPPSAWHDRSTGQPFSEDYSVSTFASTGKWAFDRDEYELLAAAAARYGALEPGEVYGFFPALQLGGAYRVENLKRVRAAEHFQILAQLDRFKLTRLTPPDPPAYPYGHVEFVRYIGHQDKR
ncbi:GAD-like domain-containing protein [Bradyrhizobium guangzhouense]|uniref:GAD-like domain-containing protein n=1 Tax=Bradyrhizobium guangzhouense TaxID=1325095 RepID=UPI001009FED9|nr:GAD-like domain-containing protein [Bradyrhizobium guangzhouense]RXH20412.1 DUF1851 domain-containing protein [Bradyrhizobium guangzhouense]